MPMEPLHAVEVDRPEVGEGTADNLLVPIKLLMGMMKIVDYPDAVKALSLNDPDLIDWFDKPLAVVVEANDVAY